MSFWLTLPGANASASSCTGVEFIRPTRYAVVVSPEPVKACRPDRGRECAGARPVTNFLSPHRAIAARSAQPPVAERFSTTSVRGRCADHQGLVAPYPSTIDSSRGLNRFRCVSRVGHIRRECAVYTAWLSGSQISRFGCAGSIVAYG